MRWLDGSCQWKPSDFDARHTMNIFYTCRCLYEEARLMFALRAKLIHSDMRLAGIPRSIQEYYYPRIRKVTVDSNLTATALDFAPFVSLEQLKICEPPLKASRYIKEMIPSSWDDVGGQECLEGSMDAKFKQAARTYCLNTMESTWVRDLLLDPTRSFKMVTPIIAVWPVGRSTAEYGGRLVSARPLLSRLSGEQC